MQRNPDAGDRRRVARSPSHAAARAARSTRAAPAGEIAAIFAGGVVGAIARAALVVALPHSSGQWPWATFLANVAGALLLGVVMARPLERLPLPPYGRRLLGTGFCGALTTFSTMQIELLGMLDGEHDALAAAYALVSVTTGLAAVALATTVVRRWEVA